MPKLSNRTYESPTDKLAGEDGTVQFMEEANQAKSKVSYICEGTCGGLVTEEEFKAGKTTCATLSCPYFGKPFKRLEEDIKINSNLNKT